MKCNHGKSYDLSLNSSEIHSILNKNVATSKYSRLFCINYNDILIDSTVPSYESTDTP